VCFFLCKLLFVRHVFLFDFTTQRPKIRYEIYHTALFRQSLKRFEHFLTVPSLTFETLQTTRRYIRSPNELNFVSLSRLDGFFIF